MLSVSKFQMVLQMTNLEVKTYSNMEFKGIQSPQMRQVQSFPDDHFTTCTGTVIALFFMKDRNPTIKGCHTPDRNETEQ